MREYILWLKSTNFEVAAFYPYTSIVCNRILSQDHNYKSDEHDFLEKFGNEVLEMIVQKGLKIDNKIVVELKSKISNDFFCFKSNIFVGFKDGCISVGLGVWQPDAFTKKNNVKF